MNSISYTEAREKLAETMKRVCRDHDPIIITRRSAGSAVLLSPEDYESLAETSYLLKSPRNARRLLDSIKALDEGKGRQRKLRG